LLPLPLMVGFFFFLGFFAPSLWSLSPTRLGFGFCFRFFALFISGLSGRGARFDLPHSLPCEFLGMCILSFPWLVQSSTRFCQDDTTLLSWVRFPPSPLSPSFSWRVLVFPEALIWRSPLRFRCFYHKFSSPFFGSPPLRLLWSFALPPCFFSRWWASVIWVRVSLRSVSFKFSGFF